LPAVSLYKIGEHYFVRDGNHRVSVARFHGAPAIDAEVVEIRGRMRTNDAQPEAGPVAPPTRRDLHDGLGAQLDGLNVQAGTLRRLIPQDPAAADEMVVEPREELRGAISDIRRLVYDPRPPALDDLGLAGALRRLAERYGSNGDQPRVGKGA
jgi:hypothetical protein